MPNTRFMGRKGKEHHCTTPGPRPGGQIYRSVPQHEHVSLQAFAPRIQAIQALAGNHTGGVDGIRVEIQAANMRRFHSTA